jgi:hypothetical protein
MSALLMSAQVSRTLFFCTSMLNRRHAGWEGELSFSKEQFNVQKWSSVAWFWGLSCQCIIQRAAFDPKGSADGGFARAVFHRLPDRLHRFVPDGMRASAPLASSFRRLEPSHDAFCGECPFVLGQ